jgi:polysaccharide export outer membrane protein
MRPAKLLSCGAFAAVIALLVLNWQAQRETQRKLDRLTGSLAVWTEPPAPPAIPPAQPDAAPTASAIAPASEPAPLPRGLNQVKHPAYVIEPPDNLSVEVVVRDAATNTTGRLPVQAISGPFLVRPDGTIGLGVWGSVAVAGLTTEQTADAVRRKVAEAEPFRSLKLPSTSLLVVVDVLAFNSKCYYVITDTTGDGERVTRQPCTGHETVLDAIANIGGLSKEAAKGSMWVARKQPAAGDDRHVLPVDWVGITQHGVTTTNYQLLPGDRLYVKAKE